MGALRQKVKNRELETGVHQSPGHRSSHCSQSYEAYSFHHTSLFLQSIAESLTSVACTSSTAAPSTTRILCFSLIERRHLIQDEIKALSILHNEMDVFENRDVFQRVADDRNDVRPFTSLEGASFIVDAQQTRALKCRYPDGLEATHASRYQKADLVGYFPNQPVRANRDLEVRVNSLGQRFPNDRPVRTKSFLQLSAMQVLDGLIIKKDAGGDNQPATGTLHPRNRLVFNEVAMLYAVNAGAEAIVKSLAANRIDSHLFSEIVSGSYCRLNLVLRHEARHFPVYQDRAGNKKLEKIRASLDVLSETTPQFLDALHRRAQESMSPLESKPPRTRIDAGADDETLFDSPAVEEIDESFFC